MRYGLCALAACLAASPAAAQNLDNKGRDFLVGFLPNQVQPLGVELHLTGDVATTVMVEYPALNPTTTVQAQVTPGQVTIVPVPATAAQSWQANVVQNNLVHASASEEFVAYMVNRAGASSDAAVALPTDALNTEYLVVDYFSNVGTPNDFVVVAAFDDTTVTITPTNALIGRAAGVPFNVTLDRGQGFMGSTSPSGPGISLTGTTISANRPVGLTNGVRCTNVPTGVGACDHVFEVAQPVQTWGTRALVANLPNRTGGSVYRIVASQDGTTVSQDGVALAPVLQRGQFIETLPLPGNHVFSANLPIFVVQFMTGITSPGASLGDPAMGNMVPSEQFQTRYTFATLPENQFPTQFLTVIADDRDLATITLDGTPIGAQAFSPIGATGFSAAVLTLAAGTHVTASSQPHGITVEGYGSSDSYLYPGGASFAFINPVGDANPPLCSLEQVEPDFFQGSARDDRPSEDVNGNNELDDGEDLNDNGEIDEDTGIFSVQLLEGAQNLVLSVDEFVPGDGVVDFQVFPDDSESAYSGIVRVSDGAGNTCERSLGLDLPSVSFDDWGEDVEILVGVDASEDEVRTAYVAVQSEGVKILDVTDPQAITTIGSFDPGSCPNGGSTADFFVDDVTLVETLDALFVAAGRCGVLALDISNPAAPVELGRYDTAVWAEAVEVLDLEEGVIAFITDHNGGLVIVDFTGSFQQSPSPPVRRGGIGANSASWGASIDVAILESEGDILAFVAASQGLRVVDASSFTSPVLIGSYDTSPTGTPPEVPQDITLVDNDIVLIAGWQGGLLSIDVSNPENPTLADEIPTDLAYYEAHFANRLVYATEGKLGLRRFQLVEGNLQTIDGEEPILLAGGDGWAWDVQVVDGFVYITYGILETGTGGLAIFEIPAQIPLHGEGGPDTDGDGTSDADDNCAGLANADQTDSDADGYGNTCDFDFDNDGVVGGVDFIRLRAAFGSSLGDAGYDAAVDWDSDGSVGGSDFIVFRAHFGSAPGPSGLACAGVVPCPSL